MIKKFLIIKLVDGREIKRDMTHEINQRLLELGAPLGLPANDEFFAEMCRSISMCGYTDIWNEPTELQYTHIAPSQMVTVQIQFEKPLIIQP